MAVLKTFQVCIASLGTAWVKASPEIFPSWLLTSIHSRMDVIKKKKKKALS